jgi:hypothetical protein
LPETLKITFISKFVCSYAELPAFGDVSFSADPFTGLMRIRTDHALEAMLNPGIGTITEQSLVDVA